MFFRGLQLFLKRIEAKRRMSRMLKIIDGIAAKDDAVKSALSKQTDLKTLHLATDRELKVAIKYHRPTRALRKRKKALIHIELSQFVMR